jgi:hypothetical protein
MEVPSRRLDACAKESERKVKGLLLPRRNWFPDAINNQLQRGNKDSHVGFVMLGCLRARDER